jgi:ribonuclease VapC
LQSCRDEPQPERLEKALVANPIRLLPVTCVFEARMVMVSRRGEQALAEIDLWLSKIGAEIIPVDVELVDLATQAWLTYGKGRHPAGLNFADCFSYALAKRADDACYLSAKILNRRTSRRLDDNRSNARRRRHGHRPSLASPPAAVAGNLQDLTDRARGYVEAVSSINTQKAYASDWTWCARLDSWECFIFGQNVSSRSFIKYSSSS